MVGKKVLIVGAGFAGVRCALDLLHADIRNLHITLINPTPHFEYHASLYRVLTGRSPLEVCIPLKDIFYRKGKIDIVEDLITDVDFNEKKAEGRSGSRYSYDYLVLALGSETAYYDIEGLKEFSFTLQSISKALELKNHLHEVFSSHVIVVGGGPAGVETAGSLANYINKIAESHLTEKPLLTIDLITSSTRLLPQLPEEISEKAEERLRRLGVNIYLNRRVMKEEVEEIYLKDMRIKTKTVIWCAGVKGNELYKKLGLPVDSKGRVLTDEFLRPISSSANNPKTDVFVIGDGAATQFSGTAQTAINHGHLTALNLIKLLHNQPIQSVTDFQEEPMSTIPIGDKWAVIEIGGINIYGRMGWWIRRLLDLRFFLSILPWNKAFVAFKEDGVLWESCRICNKEIISRD